MTNNTGANNSTTNEATNQPFVITRTFDAPRELVFKVWSELEHFKKWWGPKGMEISSATMDFRPGGVFHYCMSSPDGFEMWAKFVYQEIKTPEKIVYVNAFTDSEGNIVRAPFSDSIPLEIHYTVTFTEQAGKTTITVQGEPVHATEEEHRFYQGMFESMNQGFGGTFDQLADYLTTV